MYMPGYALLTVAGAWIAWRKNPMFSVRSTRLIPVSRAKVISGSWKDYRSRAAMVC